MQMRMRRKADTVLGFLHQNFRPFSEFSVSTMMQTQEHLRTIKIQRGERISLRGFGDNPDYFYVLKGRVQYTTPDRDLTLDALENLGDLTMLIGGNTYTIIEALEDSLICQANSSKIDELLTWDQLAKEAGFFSLGEAEEPSLKSLMSSKLFRKLPLEAVEEVFRRMTKFPLASQTDVVIQGEKGDAFYLIVHGEAEVWRKGIYDKDQKLVATLNKGDVFGEEALILGGNRNATVRIARDSLLLKLAKQDFDELIATPNIRTVSPQVANTMLEHGYRLLDVRYLEEYEERYIPGSILIPLPELRNRYQELNPNDKYLIICAAGKRAAVGALLLRQNRIPEALVVEGGIWNWPYETATIDEI